MNRSLSPSDTRAASSRLARAHRELRRFYPGPNSLRQPVHTVYGGAHLFKSDIAHRLGEQGLRSLDDYAPDPFTFARAIGLPGAADLPESPSESERLLAQVEAEPEALRRESPAARLAATIYRRVRQRLAREPVEDFRIDFEDGYGNRPDAEEDAHAVAAAGQVAVGMAARQLPAFLGIRIKPLSEELRERSIHTCDLFLTALLEQSGGKLPGNFVVTLPKVMVPEEVEALAALLARLERRLRLPAGALRLELMVETTQAILNRRGQCALPELVAAARGRCVAAHFGTYDYTASCQITAAHQTMTHPACEFAKHMMQAALAGTGVWLSDGATNVFPMPQHRAAPGAPPLTPSQREENRRAVHRGWKLHYDHIQHSLVGGFYQGWDLHPAQLPTRYAAVYAFFIRGLDSAAERLRNFVRQAAQATVVGEILDDAATGQGLLGYFLRAINSGAISEQEAMPLTGLALDELRLGSFVKILQRRKAV